MLLQVLLLLLLLVCQMVVDKVVLRVYVEIAQVVRCLVLGLLGLLLLMMVHTVGFAYSGGLVLP